MIDHDHEEGCFAGASLGRKGTCTVASLPALYFDEVDGDATTPCNFGKMRPDPCGFMAKSDEEPPDADVQQCTNDPFGEGQSQHIGQGLRYVRLRLKPRPQSSGQDHRLLGYPVCRINALHGVKLPRFHRIVLGSTPRPG